MADRSPQLVVSDNVQPQSANRERNCLCVQEATSSGPIKPPTEELVVNVVKSSAEEKAAAVIGGYLTEAGELRDSRWVGRVAMVDEKLSHEIDKHCRKSSFASVAEDVHSPQNEPVAEDDHAPQNEPDKAKCCDCLFQAYTGSVLSKLVKRGRETPAVSKVETFATVNLRKARVLGVKAIAATWDNVYSPTFFGALFRDVSVYGYLLISLVLLINELVGFINDSKLDDDPEDYKFRQAKLTFSSIGLVLSIVDLFHQAWAQKCKTCESYSKWMPEAQKRFNNPKLPKSPTTEDESPRKEHKHFSTAFDAFRIILHEMMTYPNLILSIFQLILQIVYKNGKAEPTTYISVILNLLNAGLFVYVARWVVLVASIYSIQKIRTGGQPIALKPLLSTSSVWFHIAFVLTAIGHTLVQMLMIAAIASRFHHEIQTANSISTYFPSAQLWYMMVFAYVGPFLGLMMFLVTCYFWTQQFPIELFLDILKLLKKPGFSEALGVYKLLKKPAKLESPQLDKKAEDKKAEDKKAKDKKAEDCYSSTMRKLHYYLDEERLQEEFSRIEMESFGMKLVCPFVSPFPIIFSILYFALILAFWVCAGVNGLDSTGWTYYYIIAALFVFLMNLYACVVAIVWITVFVLVLCNIVTVIIIVLLFCLRTVQSGLE